MIRMRLRHQPLRLYNVPQKPPSDSPIRPVPTDLRLVSLKLLIDNVRAIRHILRGTRLPASAKLAELVNVVACDPSDELTWLRLLCFPKHPFKCLGIG
ncbi:hypothetical protein GJ496_004106 [Pomphorhynchus laevis]|nr:hypothetical protein GJ496_004106 [Pomphorhynchus laevis]